MTTEGEERAQRLTERVTRQWALLRAERKAAHPPEAPLIPLGETNFSRAQVPWGVDLAAAWSWRILVVAAAGYLLLWLLAFFAIVTLPLVVALLLTALVSPVVRGLVRVGLPRGLAAFLVVIGSFAIVGALLTFAGQQVANGAQDLADQVSAGLDQIRTWLKTGPLDASESQINDWLDTLQKSLTERTKNGEFFSRVGEVGTALSHVLAGFFIVFFASYFFLADGERIWAWCVRLAPRAARQRVNTSGDVAWRSLTQFVRATVIVAATDAAGIMLIAGVLGVPLVLAIGVLVFIGAFVPVLGATLAGTVAVLVALVAKGPLVALLMLGGVILIQQLEGHVLQPFLMGRFVSVHPLGVIVAIGCGLIVAGIAGALVAVPIAASANAVVQHLSSDTDVGEEEPDKELAEDIEEEPDPDDQPVPDEEGGALGD